MDYLNRNCLRKLSAEAFRSRAPYPWVDIECSLMPKGFERLRRTLPSLEQFDRHVNVKRGHGQAPHDRYMLHYQSGVKLTKPWREFLAEFEGPMYREFLFGLFGRRDFIPTFAWHYAWEGCAVSPHCDAARKQATHIFYFNTEEDWDPAWGGETLILDGAGRYSPHSAPRFDELRVTGASGPSGNHSLLFQRTPHSWHGMRPLRCPAGKLRRIFSVTLNVPTAQVLWRRLRGKDPDGYKLRAA